MEITSFPHLQDAKKELIERVHALHKKYDNKKVYSETSQKGEERRKLFVITDKKDVLYIRRALKEIEAMNADILAFTGKTTTHMPIPTIVEDVLFVNIFANESISSRTSTSSKEEIISKLRNHLSLAEKTNVGRVNKKKIHDLNKQIKWFENDDETIYRVRTAGKPDVLTHIYYADKSKERLRVVLGGMFVFSSEGKNIEVSKPSKKGDRKKREGLYDNIAPIPYSGTYRSLLYRESEVIAMKEKLGYEHGKTVAAVKKDQGGYTDPKK